MILNFLAVVPLVVFCVSSILLLFYLTWMLAQRVGQQLQGDSSLRVRMPLLLRVLLVLVVTSWFLVYGNPFFDHRYTGHHWFESGKLQCSVILFFLLSIAFLLGAVRGVKKDA
jgi:hypothetical protein